MSVYREDSDMLKFFDKMGWPIHQFTENLIKGGFHRVKDFDIALHEIAWHTNYEYEFLNDIFNSYDEDDDVSYIDRIIYISEVSLERDW